MKPHLSAIIIPAMVFTLFTLFACKSEEEKAEIAVAKAEKVAEKAAAKADDAWIKAVAKHVEEVERMINDFGLRRDIKADSDDKDSFIETQKRRIAEWKEPTDKQREAGVTKLNRKRWIIASFQAFQFRLYDGIEIGGGKTADKENIKKIADYINDTVLPEIETPKVKFQVDWDVIPKHFEGDDINIVIKSLDRKQWEYESNADYLSRLVNIAKKHEKFVFKSQIPRWHGIPGVKYARRYDAEKERFIISFSHKNSFSSSFPKFSIYPVDGSAQKSILAGNRSAIDKYSDEGYIVRYFEMPRTKASEYEDKFRALFIGKIAQIREQNVWSINPFTSDSASSLHTVLYAIWLYEEVTGKVFEKISFWELTNWELPKQEQ